MFSAGVKKRNASGGDEVEVAMIIPLFWIFVGVAFASAFGIIALTIADVLNARKQSAHEWSDSKTVRPVN